jgi:hypothetical protein
VPRFAGRHFGISVCLRLCVSGFVFFGFPNPGQIDRKFGWNVDGVGRLRCRRLSFSHWNSYIHHTSDAQCITNRAFIVSSDFSSYRLQYIPHRFQFIVVVSVVTTPIIRAIYGWAASMFVSMDMDPSRGLELHSAHKY